MPGLDRPAVSQINLKVSNATEPSVTYGRLHSAPSISQFQKIAFSSLNNSSIKPQGRRKVQKSGGELVVL